MPGATRKPAPARAAIISRQPLVIGVEVARPSAAGTGCRSAPACRTWSCRQVTSAPAIRKSQHEPAPLLGGGARGRDPDGREQVEAAVVQRGLGDVRRERDHHQRPERPAARRYFSRPVTGGAWRRNDPAVEQHQQGQAQRHLADGDGQEPRRQHEQQEYQLPRRGRASEPGPRRCGGCEGKGRLPAREIAGGKGIAGTWPIPGSYRLAQGGHRLIAGAPPGPTPG